MLEVASSSSSSTTTTSGGGSQRCFTVEAYGFKTIFSPAAYAADVALLKKWAGQLAPAAAGEDEEEGEGSGSTRSGDLRVAAPRHVLGLRIPVPHPHLVPACAPTPLEIKLSVS